MPFLWGSRELLIKIFMITSRFYVSHIEPLFNVAKIIGSPGRNDSLFVIQNCFKCDDDRYSTVAFGNARITL